MHRILFSIYLLFFLPLATLGTTKLIKINQLKRKQKELLHLESQIKTYAAIERSNKALREKFKDFNSEYLYTNLEPLPLMGSVLQIIETSCEKKPFYIEKRESLANPIAVDLTEIKTILERVEGDNIAHKPHLIFSEFSLKKNKNPENITYHLDFKLTKREYLK